MRAVEWHGPTQNRPWSEWQRRTNIPVVTSSGGKGVIPDTHPLSYGSCFSPRGERQEMNQLFEVMQSADVVIGIGARFSLGNPAGESSTLVNINIDDTELTRHQANTILCTATPGRQLRHCSPTSSRLEQESVCRPSRR